MPGPTKIGTRLLPAEEVKYKQWRNLLPQNLQYEGNYDLRGLWKENPNVKPSANLHFSDKYKLPNHPTFSDESKYFNKNTKDRAGHWHETDSSWNYIPFNPSVKDTVVEKKVANNTPISKDQPVVDWLNDYVKSPKYKERLGNFYKYPDYVQRQRQSILSGTKINESPTGSTQYYSHDNELTINPAQLAALKSSREEGVSHELAHAVNANTYDKASNLNLGEAGFIMQRNKGLSPDIRESVLRSAKDSNRNVSKIMGGELHDVTPSENLSDVQAFRFLLKQRGIYDAGTQDVTPNVLKKAAQDPVIRKSFVYKRLMDSFDDNSLQEIMNKVASNKNKQSNLA